MLLPHAPHQWMLTAALALYGVFSGAMNVSMNAQAVALEQRSGRAIMSSFHALFSFGGMAGSALGAVFASQHISPAVHFAAAGTLFAVAALPMGGALISSDRGQPGQPVFAKISRPLLGLGALAFCILLNEGALADWSSVYLRRSLGTSEGTAAIGYSVFSFAMAFGRLVGDWTTERFGGVAIVRAGALAAAGGMTFALAWGTPLAAFVGFALTGAGFSIIVPLAFGAAGRTGGSAGAGLAAVNTAGYLGFLSGPAVIGFTAEFTGLRLALTIVVILSVLVALLARAVAVPLGASPVAAQEPVLQ